MRAFRNLPIKWKLMLAMLFTSTVAILLLGSALFFVGFSRLKNNRIQEVAALAEIVGGNCASVLEARDAKLAQKQLNNLAATPTVENACLYTTDGQLFARYTRPDLTPQPLPTVSNSAKSFTGGQLNVYRPVKHNGRWVGTIYVQADTWLVWERLKRYVGTGALVMGITMLVVLICAHWLQRFFSTPILELVRVAQRVAEQKDFTQRAAKLSNDETGLLADTFNKMLSLLQEHDSGSRASQSRLEKRVAERTVELRKANEALRENEQRLASLIQSAAVAIVIHAADGSITRTNETARKLLGLSESSALGKPLTDPAWVFLREDGTAMPREEFPVAQVLARREARQNFVVGIQRRQPQDIVWVLVNAVPVFDAKGNVSEVIVTFMDITERRRAEKALQRRLEVEHFVAFVSSRLANAASEEVDVAIREVLVGLGQITQTNRCYLFRVSENLTIADNTHEWCAAGVRSQIGELRDVPTAAFPWYLERLRSGEPLLLSRVADLPVEAAAEKRLCQAGNTRSVIVVPIRHAGALVGFIGCDDVRAERDWTNEDIRLLRTIGELITDTLVRLRAGEVLRRSEANLMAAQQIAHVGSWEADLRNLEDFSKNPLWWSDETYRIFGYEPGAVEVTHELLSRSISPADRDQVWAEVNAALQGRRTYNLEHRIVRPDGVERVVHERAEVVCDRQTGRPMKFIGTVQDITERKETEEALIESEDRYRSLFATSLDAVLLGTTDGRILAANAAACQMFGLSEKELTSVGRNGIADASDPRWRAATEERNRTGSFYGELTFLRSDGTKFPAEVSSVVFRMEKGESRTSVVIRDITERKRAEEALKKSRSLLLETERIGNVGGWEFNIDTQEQTWTEEVYRIHEVDLTYKPTVEEGIKFYTPASRPIITRAVQRAIEHGEPFDLELEITTAKGNLRQVHTIGKADLEHRRVFGFFQDISARKQAEKELVILNTLSRAANSSLTMETVVSSALRETMHAVGADMTLLFLRDREQLVLAGIAPENEKDQMDGMPGHRVGECLCGLAVKQMTPIYSRDILADVRCSWEECKRAGVRSFAAIPLRSGENIIGVISVASRTERDFEQRARFLEALADTIAGGLLNAWLFKETKGAEEALRAINETLEQRVAERTAAAEQRTQELKEAQRVAHIGSWTWDVETGNITWSEELYRVFGRDPKLFTPHIRDYPQILTAESLARRTAAAERTIRTGESYNIDLEIVRPDGARRWILSHGEAVRDAAGRVVNLRGTAQDITERKRAEMALRQSEEKFQRIVGHIQDVLYSVDVKTREFRYVSPAIERMLGYTEEDIRHMGGRIAFLKQIVQNMDMSVEEQTKRFERLKAEPKTFVAYRNEEWWRCKDGTLKCIEDRWIPVYDSGRLVSTEGLLCDITERRRAEAALRESQERYSSLITNLNVGVYRNTVEEGGRLLQANPALARIFGYDTVDELLKIKTEDHYQNPADRKAFLECLLSTDSVTAYELRQKKKDGTPIYCAVTATAHRGPDGLVDWIDGIVEDISDRKRLEKQLLSVSEREQRRIGQDLHDGLCQHLAGVGFMSKALAQKLARSSPAEADEARAVADLIRQAIHDARGIAAGLHPVKREANATMVALQELAASVSNLFRIQCVFNCDPPVFIEDNDTATHLYRIAQEAVNNAIRHGKARHVGITLAATDHHLTLIVQDDGKGIPEPLPAGHGIGIDIMNHRARVIGGTLDIRRVPEGGTILTCAFPRTIPV